MKQMNRMDANGLDKQEVEASASTVEGNGSPGEVEIVGAEGSMSDAVTGGGSGPSPLG